MDETNKTFVEIPGRDASAVIRGFVFQVNLTILRWIDLTGDQRLELECGEDIDTVQDESKDTLTVEKRLLEQLKVRDTRSLTLRRPEALQSVANFCRHRLNNPDIELELRYVTTAPIAVEQGWPRPEGAIDTWMVLRRGALADPERMEAVAEIRQILISCDKPEKTSEESWVALQDALAWDAELFLSRLIMPFEWGAGYGSYLQQEQQAIASIAAGGYAKYGTPDSVFEHLFAYVFRLLCLPGAKLLTAELLRQELENPSIGVSERGILRLLRDEFDALRNEVSALKTAVEGQLQAFSNLTQKVDALGQSFGLNSQFVLSSHTFSSDPPEKVLDGAPRTAALTEIVDSLQKENALLLTGELGSGKTQLLLLASEKLPQHQFWLNVPREAPESEANGMLEAFLRSLLPPGEQSSFRQMCEAACQSLGDAVVVFDDLPRIIPKGQFATRLEIFAKTLRAVGGLLLMSSYFPLPEGLAASIGCARYEVGRFTRQDVLELLSANGAPPPALTEQFADLLVAVTEGLPTLVLAAVRYLQSQSWHFTASELESLFKGEFAVGDRRDTATLLEFVIKDGEERELLVRMSLAIGDFSVEDIATVARVPQRIPLVGEKISRATGVWLQKNSDGRFTRSPLVTASMGEALDPQTRRRVHFVLAMQILKRKALAPIEIFTCFNHLLLAKAELMAALVLLQTLLSLLEMDATIEDDFGFTRMWTSITFEDAVPLDLLLYLKALQIAVLAKQGRDFSAGLQQIDGMLSSAPPDSWGAAMAASTIAIHVVWLVPAIANKYLVEALKRMPAARLPDGSAFPTPEYPLEMILWMSSYTGKTDGDADSWIATVSKLSPEQITVLESSEMMEDNVTILCDGIWRRQYDKPEQERDWATAAERLKAVEAAATSIGFPLLAAAAIRTQIVILAEWEDRLEDAVMLADSALGRFERADCRFLILEVTGRQISYKGQVDRAIPWLEQALECDAFLHSLWRRDVLITLAELKGAVSPQTAVELTARAIEVAYSPHPNDLAIAEAFAEHGIAFWKAGERLSAFVEFERAVDRLLSAATKEELWKGTFFRLFAALVYFSDVMQHGKAREGHTEPAQASFLASRDAHVSYKAEQQSYICLRLAMYADALGDLEGAARLTYRAIERACEFPEAWGALRVQCILALPQALLMNDFAKAAELAVLISEEDPGKILDYGKSLAASAVPEVHEKATEIETAMVGVQPEARLQAFLMHPFVPIAVRLITLSIEGAEVGRIEAYLSDIEKYVPEGRAPIGFVNDLRRGLVAKNDWHLLHQEGYAAIPAINLVHGYVLVLGAMRTAPVQAALGLQIMLAQHLEGFFGSAPSLYRFVIAPLFRAYWKRVMEQGSVLFSTPQAYTCRQLEVADGTPNGTRRLLAAMVSCLNVGVNTETANWLGR
jgi:hypothetical protein